MTADRRPAFRGFVSLGVGIVLLACGRPRPEIGKVQDEAMRAGRTAASFAAADEDYFRDMDGGVPLTPEEIRGRNTWLVWTGGNDRLWDALTVKSAGTLDLLKTLSTHPRLKSARHNRWYELGLVNEPCFEEATGPDPSRHGLWLDRRRADCPPDPFENATKYPGVRVDSRGKTVEAGSYYGYASGIVGLRLLPNPAFDERAARRWDPVRYYEDPEYYLSKELVRPYRVGMSCAFCHVGPSPTNPPADAENPKWENLASNVGAQYFWVDRIFDWAADESSFAFQLFHSSRPGSLDTSLVSTDNINNPRTMNAIYNLGPRLQIAKRWGEETLRGGSLNNRQFNDYVSSGPLTELYRPPATVYSPRVLKDGADSVGALGALNRVYLNIGLFSEEWLLHFNPLVGGKRVTPIEIAVARENSVYWAATEAQTPNMALFFLRSSGPHRLADAPGGAAYLTADAATLARGKTVFADYCARCHSSKAPEPAPGVDPGGGSGPDYLDRFRRYWEWTKTDEYKRQMRSIVLADDFLDGNYLSSELRIPVTLLGTNACSPLATNAIAGNIWDNFSSGTYKDLPSPGEITIYNPYTGEPRKYAVPGGGRGYTRPASLVSLWSTAPFFLNNSLGRFEPSPSVEARMASFDDSIGKLLWPERREKDSLLGEKVPGVVDRTTARSYLRVSAGYLPDVVRPLLGFGSRFAPWLFGESGIEIGPIPAGTPVGLLGSLSILSDSADAGEQRAYRKKVLALLLRLKHDLKSLPEGATDDEARRVFADLLEPLMELSKCPDYVVNRGHYFGTRDLPGEPALGDDDKRALIEFLKTL